MIYGVTAHDYKVMNDLVDFAKRTSPNGMVETRDDWDVMKVLFSYWAKQWPEQYLYFRQSVDLYREAYRYNKHGVKEDKGGGSLQHLIEMPESFYFLFHKFFPSQKLTRKFARQMADEMPDFRMHSGSKI